MRSGHRRYSDLKDALHHDVDATIFGYKPGEVPSWDAGNSLQMSI